MANRSYLFATDKIPANYEDRPETITGLSEWPYDIPIAYLLLVSQDTRVCASLSFLSEEEDNEPLALAGTAAGGAARLKRLLELLAGSRAGAADRFPCCSQGGDGVPRGACATIPLSRNRRNRRHVRRSVRQVDRGQHSGRAAFC